MKIMYVGPTIIGVSARNTVYDSEQLPEPLQAAIQKTPYLGGLLVPLSDVSDAMSQIKQGKGSIYTLYLKALGH